MIRISALLPISAPFRINAPFERVFINKRPYSNIIILQRRHPLRTPPMPVWGGVNQKEVFKTLERLHCRVVRIIFGFSPDMPTVV